MSLLLADSSLVKSQCYINGTWVGLPEHTVKNPATGDIISRVPHLGTAETKTAIEAANAALPAWRALTAKVRAQLLKKWFALIVEAQQDLAVLLTSEQGKPLAEAQAEIAYAAAYIEFYAEEAKRLAGETLPSPTAEARLLVLRQPVGVCAAITPWNFPAAMITRKIAPALAAGCTVVVKPAPETPLCALAIAELGARAGLPHGVLNIVTGDAPAIGLEMTTNPLVRLISFTGSTAVGKLLMKQAAGGVKKMALELGGNAPFIIFDDADVEAAVAGLMISKFRNMGQTCVCANRVFVQRPLYDRFITHLTTAVQNLRVGNGLHDGITQGPLIHNAAVEKIERSLFDAVQKGAKIITGGQRHPLEGTYFQPTVVTQVTPDMLLFQEETFGPVVPIAVFDDEQDVIKQANETPYGLAGYFYARDIGRIFRVAEALEVGMVAVNSGLLSTELAPFGGIKQSGFGREGSHHGIDEYLDMKYVYLGL